jgi:biopolymer transport protein TolR
MVAEINVVPYIDVMLVLLIIFMVTAPMLQQGIEVEPPKAASQALAADGDPPVVVSVNTEGQLFVNIAENPNAPVEPGSVTALVAAARSLKPERPVLVKGDAKASYEHVVRAMSLVQQAGVQKVGLITTPDERAATPVGGGRSR